MAKLGAVLCAYVRRVAGSVGSVRACGASFGATHRTRECASAFLTDIGGPVTEALLIITDRNMELLLVPLIVRVIHSLHRSS